MAFLDRAGSQRLTKSHCQMLAPDTHLKARYRILQQIGGGGFGYVYKAIDEAFGCSVAIKETKEGVVTSEKLRKAFEREAKLLRSLKHECLPRVTDYFFHDKAQFLVMDFIEGEDLAALLKQRLAQSGTPFSASEVLPIADRILSTLEYLHGLPEPIVHRDIKPGNIKIGTDGSVYLLDFGLAKGAAGQMSTVRDGESSFSLAGYTHGYAPLEQLDESGTQAVSDVYALGATLYHLLTGQRPIAATIRDEAIQRGLNDPLRSAHQVNPAIPLPISQVIEQAMIIRWWDRLNSTKKMREVLSVAASQTVSPPDPLHSLSGLSTIPMDSESQPDRVQTIPSRFAVKAPARRWMIGAASFVLLITLTVGARYKFPHWFGAAGLGKPQSELSTLTTTTKPPALTTPSNLQVGESLPGHTRTVWSVAFSPDGTLAASGSDDGTVILWDTKTWTRTRPPLTGHEGPVYQVAFSPDGTILASASRDGTIRLWNTKSGVSIEPLEQDTQAVLSIAFSRATSGGDVLASVSGVPKEGGEQIRLWYSHDDWRPRPPFIRTTRTSGHKNQTLTIALSRDGNLLAAAGFGKTIAVWNLKTGELLKELDTNQPDDKFVSRLAFSPDSNSLAAGCWNGIILLWRTDKWEGPEQLGAEHTKPITALAFSPDNMTLASASLDQTQRLWNLPSKTRGRATSAKLSFVSSGNSATQQALSFSPDGQILLSAGDDATVKVWH